MSKKYIARRRAVIAKAKKQADVSSSGFWAAFWEGLSGAGVYSAPVLSIKTKKTDLEAMRGDWRNIGKDFCVGIEKARQSAR